MRKIESVVAKYSLKEQPTDFAYWQTKSVEERFAEMERLLQEYLDAHPELPRKFDKTRVRILKKENGKFIVIDICLNEQRNERFVSEKEWQSLL